MRVVLVAFIALGLIPLLVGLRANRYTSLMHALIWTLLAWVSWGVAFVFGNPEQLGMDPGRYCAWCLTSCAGIAVLGARRPIVGAWNLVVLALFSVMVLPLVETVLLGERPDAALRIVFLAATAAVGVLNYLPTRFAPVAVLWMTICAAELALLYAPTWFPGKGEVMWLHGLLLATPWIAWLCLVERHPDRAICDRLWLEFRDRWGLFWSQRVREQFNHAAQHAGLPVKLSWSGLVILAGRTPPTPAEEEQILQTLRAVLQRFITPAV